MRIITFVNIFVAVLAFESYNQNKKDYYLDSLCLHACKGKYTRSTHAIILDRSKFWRKSDDEIRIFCSLKHTDVVYRPGVQHQENVVGDFHIEDIAFFDDGESDDPEPVPHSEQNVQKNHENVIMQEMKNDPNATYIEVKGFREQIICKESQTEPAPTTTTTTPTTTTTTTTTVAPTTTNVYSTTTRKSRIH